jgi:hypothetical protein
MSRVIVPLLAVAPARLTARTRPGWDGPSTQAFTDCREKSSGISIRVAADCLSGGEKLRESRNAHPVFSSRIGKMADSYSICSQMSTAAIAPSAGIDPNRSCPGVDIMMTPSFLRRQEPITCAASHIER